MPKQHALADDRAARLGANRAQILRVLQGGATRGGQGISVTLERFVVDRRSQRAVPYEGQGGVEALLEALLDVYRQGAVVVEGHLVGLRALLGIEGHPAPVGLEVTLGAGAQLCLTVGPADELATLLDAMRVFDRQVHVAASTRGFDLELLAQGCHPYVTSPAGVELVPTSYHSLTNAHLSQTGSHARTALRLTAATRVGLPLTGTTDDALTFRLATALAPLLAFLTDNTLRLGARDPARSPRMTRTLLWEHVDPTRCGLVPTTFDAGFGAQDYERWLEDIEPIVLVGSDGRTFSAGEVSCAHLMEEVTLDEAQARHLLSMAWPWARWGDTLEIWAADALPPRMAVGYAALVRGLLCEREARTQLASLVDVEALTTADVTWAWSILCAQGWDAQVYGRPVTRLAGAIAIIARHSLASVQERRMLDTLTQLWDAHCTPRDLLLTSWACSHDQTSDDEAALLWGEGAVIPYDHLAGDPPAGDTAVMHLDGLV